MVPELKTENRPLEDAELALEGVADERAEKSDGSKENQDSNDGDIDTTSIPSFTVDLDKAMPVDAKDVNPDVALDSFPIDGPIEIKDAQGNTLQKVNFKDGELEGDIEIFNEDGSLEEKISFKDGDLDGDIESYDEDGNITESICFEDGVMDESKLDVTKDGDIINAERQGEKAPPPLRRKKKKSQSRRVIPNPKKRQRRKKSHLRKKPLRLRMKRGILKKRLSTKRVSSMVSLRPITITAKFMSRLCTATEC